MIRCIIVDDEPAARNILETYVADTPELTLVASCKDALQARAVVKEHNPDLLFLDIQMPRLSGIDFLKGLSNPPAIILTTAYSEYALEGYELDVVDYLLKPFSFERFLKAVDKVAQKILPEADQDGFISIRADGKLYRVSYGDILFAESRGDYVTVHTTDRKLTYNQTLSGLCNQLPGHRFSRVHRSYIVALPMIDYLEGNSLQIGKHSIPVGKSFKEAFLRKYEV